MPETLVLRSHGIIVAVLLLAGLCGCINPASIDGLGGMGDGNQLGKADTTPEEIALVNSIAAKFAHDNPEMETTVTHFGIEAFDQIAEELKADCNTPYVTPKDFYRVKLRDSESGAEVAIWIDWEKRQVECVHKEGVAAAPGTAGEGGEGAGTQETETPCVEGWECEGLAHKVYRNSDCTLVNATYCGFGCSNGQCMSAPVGPCTGISCPDVCNGSTRKYNGLCVGGTCQYATEGCTYGCENGACKANLCSGVTCPSMCDGDTRKYEGQCANGVCQYSSEVCQQGCENGACKADPCAGVSCPDICDGSTRKYNGLCANGVCQYSTEVCNFGCSNGSCAAMSVGTIFVADVFLYPGDIGGISGADAKCQSYASAVGFSGTWKALISDSTTNAKDRVPDAVYRRIDGTVIANSKADLFDGGIQNPINVNEKGGVINRKTWTGSTIAGTSSGSNCSNWTYTGAGGTGTMGHGAYTDGGWIAWGSGATCGNAASLYCIMNSVSDPCAGVTCPSTCDGSTRKYNGQCVNGVCQYSSEVCQQGCENWACKADPCAGVQCPDSCEVAVRKWNGQCVGGVCQYESSECGAGCANGACNPSQYYCEWSWPQKITYRESGGAVWICTYERPYCQLTTTKCCKYAEGTGHYDCMDCEVSGCTAAPLPNGTIFVTSTTWQGNLGGVSGADAKCQSTATSAGRSGTWKALISDSTSNVKDWVPDTVYRKIDGTVIANSKADLFDGSIQTPINLTETGVVPATTLTWTGSTSSGVYSSIACNNWTTSGWGSSGTTGSASNTDSKWLQHSNDALCGNSAKLFCIKAA